jgi:hypothetical protein
LLGNWKLNTYMDTLTSRYCRVTWLPSNRGRIVTWIRSPLKYCCVYIGCIACWYSMLLIAVRIFRYVSFAQSVWNFTQPGTCCFLLRVPLYEIYNYQFVRRQNPQRCAPSSVLPFQQNYDSAAFKEFRLLGYKTAVRTSQERRYVSATESSQLMICKIWIFHGGDYEEWRLLWYNNITTLRLH